MDMEQTKNAPNVMSAKSARGGDGDFFSNYSWCLNPILTFEGLLARLEEETSRFVKYETLDRDPDVQWHRAESKLNIYLFSCAISCTLTDFLYKRPWHLAPLARMFRPLTGLILKAETVLNFPSEVKLVLKHRKLKKIQEEWDVVVEAVCRLLILDEAQGPVNEEKPGGSSGNPVQMCKDGMAKFQSQALPRELLRARMKLNEGFRCQDLTHHDIMTLANRFLATKPDKNAKFVILSPRTAGSYLAPLLKVYLEHHGISQIEWMTLRPKFGISGVENRRLRRLLINDANVILVDDYSNTGNTFRMLEKIVKSFGVPPERNVVVAPIHAVVDARRATGKRDGEDGREEIGVFLSLRKGTKIVTIHHHDLYLAKVMEPNSAGEILTDLLSADGVQLVSMNDNREVQRINEELWSHYPDSFQVRLKRLYEISVSNKNGSAERRMVFAKSVGLGWLGYHAFLAGKVLHGFVPKIYGLRNGILFMEWIDGRPMAGRELPDVFLKRMSSYLARRTKALALNEDPRAERAYLGWGWLEILGILRKAYNNLLGYLKYSYLLRRLKQVLPSEPVLVDGRMRPEEWLLCHGGDAVESPVLGEEPERFVKVDFEHHNFGAPGAGRRGSRLRHGDRLI